MPAPVQLYVYDLSNGLAKQLSLQLTGKQIDGIWHTSVVVFGKEIFYGQGISITSPGQSHHGRPLQAIDMGETALDEETFNEYLEEMRQVYTADKYHLLDNNCNSFTNDCMGFLTGGSIPSWIKDLPADFLSTPFGAALRPTIDNMFRGPAQGGSSAPSSAQPLASSLLQSVAQNATGVQGSTSSYLPTPAATPSPPLAASSSIAGPIQICSNTQHFNNLLSTHKAVIAFFTSHTCPPCRIIEPVFERLASEKASAGVAFAKIDLGSAYGGGQIASVYGVRVTPTFLFFMGGKKTHELKGADAGELKAQVDLLTYQAFPPHPHASLPLRATRSISLEPILFTQSVNFEAVRSRLFSFIDLSALSDERKKSIENSITSTIIPYLKNKADEREGKGKGVNTSISSGAVCEAWRIASKDLIDNLQVKDIFPLADLLRLTLLDNPVAQWCSTTAAASGTSPPHAILERVASALRNEQQIPKPVLLTTLRMAANMFTQTVLARTILVTRSNGHHTSLTTLAISCLLHDDSLVRTAAASLVFNMAAFYQAPRMEALRSGRRGEAEEEGDGEWEVELLSAVLEAIKMEESNEDVLHRLVASLAFLLHLSPFYETQLKPMLEVLEARSTLLAKLEGVEGGFTVSKKEARALLEEVGTKLCG
ncbi:DUF862-domain-containing protein [Schizopora paradoxa]|uniref:DUF862-domain-containing protein n=1 Tax=Schizopora paradoxa TaxID=27342 RepID=A0A0H2SJI3_9AGAM|nr:DUF862-domain-containing protein [Schizopora paradoxa]